jgi:hypothetical protein
MYGYVDLEVDKPAKWHIHKKNYNNIVNKYGGVSSEAAE